MQSESKAEGSVGRAGFGDLAGRGMLSEYSWFLAATPHMIPSCGDLEWLCTSSLGDYRSRDDLGGKMLKLQEKKPRNDMEGAQSSISWPNQRLPDRSLISSLEVSFLKGDMASRGDGRNGKVESVCILGSICATNLWCVLEQVTSHLSAYFQSIKQSIWVRQSVKSFQLWYPMKSMRLTIQSLSYTLTQWVRSWLRWHFHFIETVMSLLKYAAFGFYPHGVGWASDKIHSATSVCPALWTVLKEGPHCSGGACSPIGESHKHRQNDKRWDPYLSLPNESYWPKMLWVWYSMSLLWEASFLCAGWDKYELGLVQ